MLPTKLDESAIETHELAARIAAVPRGIVPEQTKWLTAGVDIGKYLAHWIVVAWRAGATGHVVDYGLLEVASEDLGVEKAIQAMLREFRDLATTGWPVSNAAGNATRR